MTAEELVAQARENRPAEPPPSLGGIDQGLRKLLRPLLSAFAYDEVGRERTWGRLPDSRGVARRG